jgi:hypothetical protein
MHQQRCNTHSSPRAAAETRAISGMQVERRCRVDSDILTVSSKSIMLTRRPAAPSTLGRRASAVMVRGFIFSAVVTSHAPGINSVRGDGSRRSWRMSSRRSRVVAHVDKSIAKANGKPTHHLRSLESNEIMIVQSAVDLELPLCKFSYPRGSFI